MNLKLSALFLATSLISSSPAKAHDDHCINTPRDVITAFSTQFFGGSEDYEELLEEIFKKYKKQMTQNNSILLELDDKIPDAGSPLRRIYDFVMEEVLPVRGRADLYINIDCFGGDRVRNFG